MSHWHCKVADVTCWYLFKSYVVGNTLPIYKCEGKRQLNFLNSTKKEVQIFPIKYGEVLSKKVISLIFTQITFCNVIFMYVCVSFFYYYYFYTPFYRPVNKNNFVSRFFLRLRKQLTKSAWDWGCTDWPPGCLPWRMFDFGGF